MAGIDTQTPAEDFEREAALARHREQGLMSLPHEIATRDPDAFDYDNLQKLFHDAGYRKDEISIHLASARVRLNFPSLPSGNTYLSAQVTVDITVDSKTNEFIVQDV